jgi:TPR repeat protein
VQIGPYQILDELGRGGMGAVYRGRDSRTAHEVAIKVLIKGRGATTQQRARFQREARALAKVNHPNVVRLLELGEHEGAPYLVMDYHRAGTLQETLDSQLLDPLVAARLGAELAEGLAAAHAVGVLHRDLKPDNVLIGAAGRSLLTDFGLAKDLDRLGETQRLTATGMFLGSPGFWAPEQAAGTPEATSFATDVYGLGAVLYAALTGRAPVEGATLVEIVIATREQTPPRVRSLRPEVPGALEAIVQRCLKKDPSARWPSAAALGDALRSFVKQDQAPAMTRPQAALPLVLCALGLAVAGALFSLTWHSPGQPVTPAPAAASPALAPTPSADSIFKEAVALVGLKRYETALPLLRRAAEQDHADAMNRLGFMHGRGDGLAPDPAGAAAWFRRAADLGHAQAMSNLATMLSRGEGVAKDPPQAMKLFRNAAEMGCAEAMHGLANMLAKGEGGPRDEPQAVMWLRRAAQLGNLGAMFNLANMLRTGRGVLKDEALAVKWYRGAAEKGHANAMANLGVMLASGLGVTKDEAESVKWYRLAAEKGNTNSMFNLGVMLRSGQGVPKDEQKAALWFRRGATKGNAGAMSYLATMLERGRGVPRDEAEALKWYRLALEHGNAQVRRAAEAGLRRLAR